MAERVLPGLDPVSFLQTFVTETIKMGSEMGCPACDCGARAFLEHLGLTASAGFEAAWRAEIGLAGKLDPDDYAELIVALKNSIGGAFSRVAGPPGTVRVINTRCPFGDRVRRAPELCQMTSSVFGGIAARNFGVAKVSLLRTIARGATVCEIRIRLGEADQDDGGEGDVYRVIGTQVVGRAASAEISERISDKMRRTWGGGRPDAAPPTIVATSAAMRSALEVVEIVAPTEATVLITGETGVGKEVVARAVHALSSRCGHPFLAVNCGALPESLVESALFGHERGAFTGAHQLHQGFFERAAGGTLFLDEIDSLPLAAQARLLRVLQGQEFERVGGRTALRANVRVVAAGSQALSRLVDEGRFRSDLFYRLNVVPIVIPPLRQRPEDLPALTAHILQRLAQRHRRPSLRVTEEAMAQILAYPWPGNVRELENALERSFLLNQGPRLERVLLPAAEGQSVAAAFADAGATDAMLRSSLLDAKRRAADSAEAEILGGLLSEYAGNVRAVAQKLGLTPRAIYRKLTLLGMHAASYRRRPSAAPPSCPLTADKVTGRAVARP